MDKFLMKLVDGHLIVSLKNFSYIIDTGSPLSFGRDTSIVINEKSFPINNIGPDGLTIDSLNVLSGLNVDGLIGMDILIHFDIQFSKSEIIFSDTPIIFDVDLSIKLSIIERSMGIPIIILNIGNADRRIFFDTGAKLSYLSEDLLIGTSIGQMEDFYPLLGTFKTNIYQIDVIIKGKIEKLIFGSLPPSIRILLQMGQTKGIIGTQLLQKYSIILSNLTNILILKSYNEDKSLDRHQKSDHQSIQIEHNSSFVRELSLD